MITRMPRSCVAHRAALLDFVDGQPRTDASAAALRHLERCRACEEELAGIVRTLAALRRLGESVKAAEPSADAWDRVRARAVRAAERRWVTVANTAGGLLAASIVAAMVVSLTGLPRSQGFTLSAPSVSRLDAFEPRTMRLPRADFTVFASTPLYAGNPQPPDGDRVNLAGVLAQSGAEDGPARSVSRA